MQRLTASVAGAGAVLSAPSARAAAAGGWMAAVSAVDDTGRIAGAISTVSAERPTSVSTTVAAVGGASCTVSNGPLGSYRSGCVKIAVLVTDAHPGGCDDSFTTGVDDVHAHSVALAAAKAGIVISAIYVPTSGQNDEIRDIMED